MKKRETFCHWELDTIVSGRGKSKGRFATFVEQKTRIYTAIQMKDRTSEPWVESRSLFQNVTCTIPTGAKVAIIGKNSAGKSTLPI